MRSARTRSRHCLAGATDARAGVAWSLTRRGLCSAQATGPVPTAGIPTVTSGAIACPALTPTSVQDFLTCQYEGTGGEAMTFYLYVPRGYDPQKSYPLVLLLHGGGERADPQASAAQNRTNVLKQEYVRVWGPGYPSASDSVQNRWPSFVVVPQVSGSNRWVNVDASVASYSLSTQPSPSLQMAMAIVQLLRQQLGAAIDSTRLYVTGISMGAFGVWDAIERWPTVFAAAVPVSGAGDPTQVDRIAQMPLWDFHGGADTNVPVQGSREMIQALRSAWATRHRHPAVSG